MADRKFNVDETAVKKSMSRKKQVLIFVICSVLAMSVCMCAVLGAALSLVTEGVYETPLTPEAALTEMPVGKEETLAYLSKIASDANDNKKTYVKLATEVAVSDDNLEVSGENADAALLQYIKGDVLTKLDALYPADHEGKFDEGFTAFARITLDSAECTDATCVRGAQNDAGELIDENFYFIQVTLPGGSFPAAKNSGVYRTFSLEDEEAVLSGIREEVAPVCKVTDSKIVPAEFTVEAKADCLTDRLSTLQLTRRYRVTLHLEFTGKLKAITPKTVSFDYSVKEQYEYFWAGISFLQDSVNVAPGKEVALDVNAILNEDSDYTVTFSSSDEKALTVDSMGYAKGITEGEAPVTVTVTLDYLGCRYTDTCEVTVHTPVEKIKISDEEARLAVGEQKKLSASLKPKDATVRSVYWVSEDEAVATVDEDGTVKAVGAGTVRIIAVAVDGNLRDSCEITVTKGGEPA